MERAEGRDGAGAPAPLRWVDLAKGICILLVVMMHSALGVDLQPGQGSLLHAIVAWTKPFRMPDFFFLAGFLSAGIAGLSWSRFLDRRILHYLYFYVLWLVIILATKATVLGIASPGAFGMAVLKGLVEPFSTLWFIHILPAFLLIARFAQGRLRLPILAAAIGLHLLAANHLSGGSYALTAEMTASTAVDSFALFFVFFLAGYLGAGWISHLTQWAARAGGAALGALGGWAALHSLALLAGFSTAPFMPLLLGLAGAIAVTAFATLLARLPFTGWLAFCGRHSLAIYLAFVIPMAMARMLLERVVPGLHPGWIAFFAMLAGVVLPLLAEQLAPRAGLGFLFKRPGWARIAHG